MQANLSYIYVTYFILNEVYFAINAGNSLNFELFRNVIGLMPNFLNFFKRDLHWLLLRSYFSFSLSNAAVRDSLSLVLRSR